MDGLMLFLPGVGVAILVVVIYYAFFERRARAKEHIQTLMGQATTQSGNPVEAKHVQQILKRKRSDKPMLQKLEIDIERANFPIRAKEFIGICLLSGGVCALLGLLFGLNMALALLIGVVGLFLPRVYLAVSIMMRMNKAVAQFADVLDAMVNCFKSGYGFSRSIQVVSDNFDDPWGTEFSKMSAEMALGTNLEDALGNLSSRLPSPDMDLFVTAILLQKETGGNMVELLTTLSTTIRDRFKLFRKVSALSAHGRLSAIVIFCIPFAIGIMLYVLLPSIMIKFLTNPIGIVACVISLILVGIGGLVMKHIVTLEV